MNDNLENKLAVLRERYKDGDSLQYINDIEAEYSKLIQEKDFLSNPIFIDIVSRLEKTVNDLNAILMNEIDLTENERFAMFAERKALRIFASLLNVKIKDSALIALEDTIDRDLAKTS